MTAENIELTVEEAAVIAAECSMSLSDNRCKNPESRATLERIIEKMGKPFGFQLSQLRALTDAVAEVNRVYIN